MLDCPRQIGGSDPIIDNDSLKPASSSTPACGETMLEKGEHDIEIKWFKNVGAMRLEFLYSGPGEVFSPFVSFVQA